MKKERPIYLILGIVTVFLFAFELETSVDENKVFKDLDIDGIQNVLVNTSANIYFLYAEESDLKVEGNSELIENLEIVKIGQDLVVQIKRTYNPVKLLKLAYLSRQPLNIYFHAPQAKEMKVINRDKFAKSHSYESELRKMVVLQSPKLFTNNIIQGATCSTLSTSIL